MEVTPPQTLMSWLATEKAKPRGVIVWPYEGQCQLTLKQGLNKLSEHDIERVAILIGSEGGFSMKEKKDIESLSIEPLSLGEQVLRVETACVSVISILKYELAPKQPLNLG